MVFVRLGSLSRDLLLSLRIRLASRKIRARVVNNTDSTLVLRSKYRDIWEAERLQIAQGESGVVTWTPDQPYIRMGAFVQTDQAGIQQTVPRILITPGDIVKNKEIKISFSPVSNEYEVQMIAREGR